MAVMEAGVKGPSVHPRLKRRVQLAAFAVAMLVAGSIALVQLAMALHDLPRAAEQANRTAARVFGTYLSASLDNRVDDILQLGDSSLVWTALSDSRERDIYLKPFLEERNRAQANTRLALLDYRGRFVAGDAALHPDRSGEVKRLVADALASREPGARLSSEVRGRLWVGIPIDFPYTDDAIGVLLGAVDLEGILSNELGPEIRDLGVSISDGKTRWILRGSEGEPVYASAFFPLSHRRVSGLYALELETHSTSHPWIRGLILRGLVLAGVAGVVAALVWWVAGVAAKRVSQRLEDLASVIATEPACGPADIPADPNGDEIALLGDALRQALLAHQDAAGQLERLAYYDRLTGLMNRAGFEDRLDQALRRAQRAGTQVGLMFIDLDRFKAVNDTLGHAAGDHLLRVVAQRISTRVRSTDAVSRRSGDEFTLMVEDCRDQKGAAQLAEELISLLSMPYQLESGATVAVGASIGIAFYPSDAQTLARLLQCADAAMYAAKERGTGGYCIYSAELGKSIHERLRLEARLRDAVSRDQLELLFQPQARLADGRIIGAEALCRWRDAELGEVPPSVFIPVAEETGLIRPMGLRLLRQACDALATWRTIDEHFFVALNVSAKQLTEDFPKQVCEILKAKGIPCAALELELSEGAFIHARAELEDVLEGLRAAGVSVVVDDFGARYSSLHFLRGFKFRKLKMDLSMVEGLLAGPEDRLMVWSLIDLSHRLGLEVIAEGIEREAQLAALVDLGCDMGQGYFLGPPAAADELSARLRADGADQRRLRAAH